MVSMEGRGTCSTPLPRALVSAPLTAPTLQLLPLVSTMASSDPPSQPYSYNISSNVDLELWITRHVIAVSAQPSLPSHSSSLLLSPPSFPFRERSHPYWLTSCTNTLFRTFVVPSPVCLASCTMHLIECLLCSMVSLQPLRSPIPAPVRSVLWRRLAAEPTTKETERQMVQPPTSPPCGHVRPLPGLFVRSCLTGRILSVNWVVGDA